MTKEQLERELEPLCWRKTGTNDMIGAHTDIGMCFYIHHIEGAGYLGYIVGQWRDFEVVKLKAKTLEEAKAFFWDLYAGNVWSLLKWEDEGQ
nr:MAG TPA: hypothetical protein [Caudoviricetes sp.]